jgi:hypothetical protein
MVRRGELWRSRLDAAFFSVVAVAQPTVPGDGKVSTRTWRRNFPICESAQQGYDSGELQYAASGGGAVCADDYDWSVAAPPYIERVWGAAGFQVVEGSRPESSFRRRLVFILRCEPIAEPVEPDHVLAWLGTSLQQARGRMRQSNGK